MLYTVVTLDADGCELRNVEVESFKSAREEAYSCAKDKELKDAGAVWVKVRDAGGECVFDRRVLA